MIPWAIARQGPLSVGFPGQEYWIVAISRIVAISFSRGFSWVRDQGSTSPALAGGFFTTEPPGRS